MKKHVNAPSEEPTESNFKIPSEKEHLLQVIDCNPLVTPSGQDDNIQIVKLEVVGGEEAGLTLLNRLNLNQDDKGFYFTRLFLKSIGESYKGAIEIDTDNWQARQFYATVKHTKSKDGTKTYANIGEYNFDKLIKPVLKIDNPTGVTKPEDIAWND